MNQNFGCADFQKYIPVPVCDEHPEYLEFYQKAWQLAFDHIKHIPGMPQSPYMDEAFCASQVWIWDTCFMTFFCKYAREAFPGIETLNNFYEVLHGKKRLPTIIPPENEPEWTGAIPGEPFEMKVHIADNPPLFAWAEYENALMSGDREYIKDLLYNSKFLQKHYDWIENLKESVTPEGVFAPTCLIAEKDGYLWEGGRSGMDNTPRGRIGEHAYEQRPNNPDMLWLDAICQQALASKMIANMFNIVDDKENEELWNKKYLEKAETVNSLYWDEKDGFYYDIDRNSHKFYKIMTPASYWTMTSEIAPQDRAQQIAKQLCNPKTLGGFVPFVSLSRSDADYSPGGEYWRGGVWLPTAYATLKGLANYGMFKQAHETSLKLLEHMYKTYTEFEPHTIWECYSPEEYKPAAIEDGSGRFARPDFCGWSALGPISVYIEFVLGFYSINAFEKTVKWAKPDTFKGKIGIKNLHFGDIVTDIEAENGICTVKSTAEYTLEIDGKAYVVTAGENQFNIG